MWIPLSILFIASTSASISSLSRFLQYESTSITYDSTLNCGTCISGGYTYCVEGTYHQYINSTTTAPSGVCCEDTTCDYTSNSSWTCSSSYSDTVMQYMVCPFVTENCGTTSSVEFTQTGESETLTTTTYPGDVCVYAIRASCGAPAIEPNSTDDEITISALSFDDDEVSSIESSNSTNVTGGSTTSTGFSSSFPLPAKTETFSGMSDYTSTENSSTSDYYYNYTFEEYYSSFNSTGMAPCNTSSCEFNSSLLLPCENTTTTTCYSDWIMPCDNSTGLCTNNYLVPCPNSTCDTAWVECATDCSFEYNSTLFEGEEQPPTYDEMYSNYTAEFNYSNSTNSSTTSDSSSSYTANLNKPAKQVYDNSQGGMLKYKDSYQNDVSSISSNTTEFECAGRNSILLVQDNRDPAISRRRLSTAKTMSIAASSISITTSSTSSGSQASLFAYMIVSIGLVIAYLF